MEERNFVVYKHTSPSGKVYIGITCQDIQARWKNGYGYTNNKHFYNAINKYGWDNIEHEILFNNLTEEEAKLMEQMYIALYDSNNPNNGYNRTLGGDGAKGIYFTAETRKKMSISAKNRTYKPSPEHLIEYNLKRWENEDEHIKQSNRTKEYWMNNRNQIINSMKKTFATEENKQKRGNATKKLWLENEYREKRIKNLKARWDNDEYKEKMSNIFKQKFNSDKYKEKMEKIWESRKEKFVLLNNRKIFKGLQECKEYVHLKSASSIVLCCQNKRCSAGKYNGENAVWVYYEDFLKMNISDIEEKLSKGKNSRKQSNSNLQSRRRKVICITINEIFDSIADASRKYTLNHNCISNCCRGLQKTTGKLSDGTPLKWMYYEDYLKLNNKKEIV
nr:MAG TPA: intron associated endonuclease [Caudoviricetes sp.]